MRALEPSYSGVVDRDGVGIGYEVYGEGEPTVYLLAPDIIVDSRAWKAQVPFLARSFRVVVSDPRGNGRSGAPRTPEGFSHRHLIDDAWAVLDAVGVERAVLVGLCTSGGLAVLMAAEAPERVLGVFAINPWLVLGPRLAHLDECDFEVRRDRYDGWQKVNRHHWLADWPDYARFFFTELIPEPHSTKQLEDCVGWALQPGPETMVLDADAPPYLGHDPATAEAAARAVRCPVFVVTGSLDQCQNPERGRRLAELTGGEYVALEGAGHLPQARDPVKVNILLRDFVRRIGALGRPAAGHLPAELVLDGVNTRR